MSADVVVAGAGPAGSVAARQLALAGVRVVMVDGGGGGGGGFGETLVSAARPLLASIGLWDGFVSLAQRRCPGTDSAWGSARLASTSAVLDPNGAGWHLDRRRFDRWLVDEAASSGVTVVAGQVRRAAGRGGAGGGVELEDGRSVTAGWLIDASGRRSVVSRSLGVRRRGGDKAVALVAWTAATGDADGRTLVESVPGGWWYTAVSPDGARVVMFVTDRDLVPAGARSRAGFASLLGNAVHVRSRVGGAELDGEVRQVAAGGSWLESVAGRGCLAVGDAACAFDPLSSQGVFSALYTGMTGADAVAAALSGDEGALATYEARVAAIVTNYERNAGDFYGFERRWPDQPFWSRRALTVAAPLREDSAIRLSARGATAATLL